MATAIAYNLTKKAILDGNFPNLAGVTVKLMLLTDSYTPNIDTDEFIDDISANESSGTGYTAGGATVTVSNSTNTTDDRAEADHADVTITGWDGSWRYAVWYVDTGTPSTSRIIGGNDFGASDTGVGDTIFQVPTTGFLHIT